MNESICFTFFDKSGNPIGHYVPDVEKLTEAQFSKMMEILQASDNCEETISWSLE